MSGIEVNSEAKLREYCPSAEGARAIFSVVPSALGQYSRNFEKLASLLIDDDSHYLFCYTSDRNGDGINLMSCVILH